MNRSRTPSPQGADPAVRRVARDRDWHRHIWQPVPGADAIEAHERERSPSRPVRLAREVNRREPYRTPAPSKTAASDLGVSLAGNLHMHLT